MSKRPFLQIARCIACLLLVALAGFAHAGCSLRPYDVGFQFSDAALAARDAFYASLCDESFAELIALPDSRLHGRLRAPTERRLLSTGNPYPEIASHLGLEGGPVVSFVVETDGSIRHVILIQSSDHRLLDEGAVRLIEQSAFDKPGTLDGLPVRTLVSMRVSFVLNGSQALPASLTDSAIIDFGNRMMNYCNRGDADGLYAEFDALSGAGYTVRDLKQQLRIYNGLYGQIVSARFVGLLAIRKDNGFVTFPLVYALGLDRPGEEEILMTVGITVHSGTPRLASFSLNRARLRQGRPSKSTVH